MDFTFLFLSVSLCASKMFNLLFGCGKSRAERFLRIRGRMVLLGKSPLDRHIRYG